MSTKAKARSQHKETLINRFGRDALNAAVVVLGVIRISRRWRNGEKFDEALVVEELRMMESIFADLGLNTDDINTCIEEIMASYEAAAVIAKANKQG